MDKIREIKERREKEKKSQTGGFNEHYSLLICASYFISCSVHAQFTSIILIRILFAKRHCGIGIFYTSYIFQHFIAKQLA